MRITVLSSVLLFCVLVTLGGTQEPSPAPEPTHQAPLPGADLPSLQPNSTVPVTVGSGDAPLGELGPAKHFRFEFETEGQVYIWAEPERLRPHIRITNSEGKVLERLRPKNYGQATWPIGTNGKSGVSLTVSLACATEGAPHSFELAVRFQPETEESKKAAKRARDLLQQFDSAASEKRFDEAKSLLIEARDVLGAIDHSYQVDRVRWGLGVRMHHYGFFGEAIDSWQASLRFREAVHSEDATAPNRVRWNLAVALDETGQYDAANRMYRHVITVMERTLVPDATNLLSLRMNHGAGLVEQGRHSEGLELLEKAAETALRTLPEGNEDWVLVLNNLAESRRRAGDVEGARQLQEEVLAAAKEGLPSDHPMLIDCQVNLAATLNTVGDKQRERELLGDAIEATKSLPPEHPTRLHLRRQQAEALAEADPGQALVALDEIHARQATSGAPTEELLLTQRALARVLRRLGSREGGEEYLKRAKTLEEKTFQALTGNYPETHYVYLLELRRRAYQLLKEGQPREALKLAEKRLEILTRVSSQSVIQAHVDHGWAALLTEGADREGVVLGALPKMRLAWARQVIHLSPREADAYAMKVRRQFWGTFDLLERLESESARARGHEALLPLLEMSRAVGQRLRTQGRALASDEAKALGTLRTQVILSSRKVSELARVPGRSEEFVSALEARERAERELRSLLSKSGGRFASIHELDYADIAGSLQEGEAAVSFWAHRRTRFDPESRESWIQGDPILLAHVLRSGEALRLVDLGALDPIQRAAQSWREALKTTPGEAGREKWGEHGETLRRLLLDPLDPALGDASRVFVAADDVVHSIPLDALPWGEGLVGDRRGIVFVSALWQLLDEAPRKTEAGLFLAVGGLDYSASASEAAVVAASTRGARVIVGKTKAKSGPWRPDFRPLAGAGREIDALAQLHESVFEEKPRRLLRGPAATKDELVRLAPLVKQLHLATHGYFAPESIPSAVDSRGRDAARSGGAPDQRNRVRGLAPMALCGLALSGANAPPDRLGRTPGLLAAEELATLDLSGCELAVLSACDTNVGVRRAGQGIASLQSALHAAGVRTALTSLWPVQDEATKELMVEFYRRVWILKEPKDQALWNAKMALAARKDPDGNSLYSTRDWAGWVLSGDPD